MGDVDIRTVVSNISKMLAARGDDVSYIEEHAAAVDTHRFFSELITLDTDRTMVLFALCKKVLMDWKADEDEDMISRHGRRNFVMVLADSPSSPMMQFLIGRDKAIHAQGGMLQVFLLRELMYNPLDHELVPPHSKLSEQEARAVLDSYMIKHRAQLPAISRSDAIARRLGLQQGDIVRITRYSETSGMYNHYRCVV